MKIVIAILIFSIIIIIHELGHFILAKLNGITVTEFSVGMGPRLVSTTKGETRYSLKLLPFGGSCMMLGEDEAAGDDGSFGSKSVWARISVSAAGPIFNFILAFVLALFIIGSIGHDSPVVGAVTKGFPAAEAGLKVGDVITKMNNKNIRVSREINNYVTFNQGKPVTLTYERDGESHTVQMTPEKSDSGRYLFGISPAGTRVKGNPISTLKYSAYEVKYWIDTTIGSLKMLIRGQVGINDMSGPVGVVTIIGDTYEESAKEGGGFLVWLNMLNISILLTANLGVMNLLPLPALDGGRLVFLILEAIRGKRISPEKEGMVHFVGLMALMILMIVVMFNDVMKIL